jgi:hypothetical protein
MKVIGMASTYGTERLAKADAVVQKLGRIQVSLNGTGKLTVEI